jgi:hypothetical protein
MEWLRLNADSSFLVKHGHHFLVIDPWLMGTQTDLAPWFSTQALPEYSPGFSALPPDFDVFISHPFTDHFHEPTLQKLGEKRILGREKKVKTWTSGPIHIRKYGRALLHSLFEFHTPDTGERVLYSPHGWRVSKEAPAPGAKLWLTGLQKYTLPWWIGGTISGGIPWLEDGLRRLQPSQFSHVHGTEKQASGWVARWANIQPFHPKDLSDAHKGKFMDLPKNDWF